MKKQSILAMAMVIGLTGNIALPTQAASGKCSLNTISQTENCVVIGGKVNSLPEVKSVLEEFCNGLQNGNWKDCTMIQIPSCNQSDSSTPDMDDSEGNQSDNNAPESGIPDVPETNQSDDNTPENNIPDVPEINQPEMNVPGEDANESETDNNEMENDKEENSFAAQVVKLVNEERVKAGLNPVTLNKEVASAALIRAKEIEVSFSHTRTDGRMFGSVLTDNGIRFNRAGENIAWGQTSPEQVMEAWMNSEGHRANILNPNFTEIGVGHYQNSNGRNYWVQLFVF